jgi:preprotein translocase subunit SecG
MVTFVTILFVLTALVLIGVVLIQQPKTSGGLFSGTGQSLLGTSGKTFWMKFTSVLAGVFMLLCLLLYYLPRHEGPQSSVAGIIEKQQQEQAAQSSSQPAPQANPAPQAAPASPEKPKK